MQRPYTSLKTTPQETFSLKEGTIMLIEFIYSEFLRFCTKIMAVTVMILRYGIDKGVTVMIRGILLLSKFINPTVTGKT